MPINKGPARAQKRSLMFGAAIAAPLLGAGPIACLSDVTLPQCVKDNTCVASGGQVSGAGSPNQAGGNNAAGGSSGSIEAVAGDANAAGADTGSGGGDGGRAGAGTAQSGGGTAQAGEGTAQAGGGAGGAATIECDTCVVSPFQLSDPCAGKLFSSALRISGGHPPYQWTVSPPVGTWDVVADTSDSSRANLIGTANGPVDVTIEVTDQGGRVVKKVYSLAPRNACYFAYVAPDSGNDPKLTLLDPLLGVPAPITLSHNQGVYDFQFSPSGRFLTYRFQDTNSTPVKRHLSLIDLRTWEEHPLDFGEDSVTAYAWSNDSRFLAVTFDASQATWLGGIQVTAGATPNSAVQLDTLTPVVSSAPAESGLFWLGTTFVTFYATVLPGLPNPLHRITPFYAQLDAGGFQAPIPNTDNAYLAPVTLQPTDAGIFMITGNAPGTAFHAISAVETFSTVHDGDVIAPSGQFGANLSGNRLQIFRAEDDDLFNGSLVSSDGCGKMLTWAQDKERIACVTDVPGANSVTPRGEIRIFDLSTGDTPALSMSTLLGSCDAASGGSPGIGTCPASAYQYTESGSNLQPRLLSASGRWLAFTTNTQQSEPGNTFLYWADLDGQPLTVKRRDTIYVGTGQTTTRNVLTFSPDERYLLLQTGSILSIHLLNAPQSTDTASQSIVIDSGLLPPSASATCSEDFGTAPGDWCGAANRASSMRWAADSKRLAFRSLGTLTVVDQFSISNFDSHTFAAAACGSQCSGDFAFQPEP